MHPIEARWTPNHEAAYFSPSLNEALEDRLALSVSSAVGIVHHVVTAGVVNDVNHKVDLAFAQFNKEYKKEVTQVARTGNDVRYEHQFAVSTAKLKKSLDKQAARIPGGTQILAPCCMRGWVACSTI